MDEPGVSQVGLNSREPREDHRVVGHHDTEDADPNGKGHAKSRSKAQAETRRWCSHPLIDPGGKPHASETPLRLRGRGFFSMTRDVARQVAGRSRLLQDL